MSFIPKPHEIYKHFKGNLYQIVTIAEHSETGEQMVVYQALYGDFKTYARPLDMFTERVDKDKYPEANQEFRFELQGADNGRQREHVQEADKQDKASCQLEKIVQQLDEAEKQSEQSTSEELSIDPMVLEFLDADTYEQRLNILAALHHRITDEMITTMAISCDVEVTEGDTEARYDSLKSCLLTREKYECNRLR